MKKHMTVNELFHLVYHAHWTKNRFKNSGWALEVQRSYMRGIDSTLGHLDVSEVTREKVRAWHECLAKTPYGANRALEVLSKMFQWGVQNDRLQHNPCLGVEAFPERKRKRYATEEELQKILTCLDTEERGPKRAEAVFLLALLMTGARPRSLERAKRMDLMVVKGFGYLTTEGKKMADTGEPDEIVFPPSLMERINNLPKDNDLLFGGVLMPRRLWDKIRKEVGCTDLRARDLRRTFATVGLSNGVKLDTLGELLNHKSTQTTKIYAQLVPDAKFEAVDKIEQKLNQIRKAK